MEDNLIMLLPDVQLRALRNTIDYVLDFRPRAATKFNFIHELFEEHNNLRNFIPLVEMNLVTTPKLYIIEDPELGRIQIIHYEYHQHGQNIHIAYEISENFERFLERDNIRYHRLPWFVASSVDYPIDLYTTPINTIPEECVVLAILIQDGLHEGAFMFRENI